MNDMQLNVHLLASVDKLIFVMLWQWLIYESNID